jgi:hypothetical protein
MSSLRPATNPENAGGSVNHPAEHRHDRARPSLWRACRERKWLALLLAALLTLHGTLAVQTARYCSVTHDEYWHIPVGLLHWRSGQFDWENLNPPLIRMLAAAPLTVTAEPGRIGEPTDQIWSYGDDLFAANRDNYRSLLIQARLPIVVLSLLTAWLLGCWATELFGLRSGVIALFLWCVSPTVLASASLVTTDLGAAFFFSLAGWRAWRLAGQPNGQNAVLLGICVGLAQLAKYTSVVLWPLSLIWCLLLRTPASASSPRINDSRETQKSALQSVPRTTELLRQWCAATAISILILNLGYLFQGTGTALGGYEFSSQAMRAIQSAAGPLSSLPLPVPADWLQGIDHQRQMMEADHPVFLNGDWSLRGFRGYYFYVLWYKLPHVVQLLTAAALLGLWKARTDHGLLRVAGGLLLPVFVLLVLANGSGMQLGIRYVLPVLPFLFLFAASLAQTLPLRPGTPQRIVIGIVAAAALSSVRYHPHHLAYFNERAGGPDNGWRLLSDSNIDWGQDLYGLEAWLRQNPVEQLHLAWFGTLPPSDLGVQTQRVQSPLLTGTAPEPGVYAVSVCLRQGRPTPIREPDHTLRSTELDEFGWLRFFEPSERIGQSVHIFRLSEADIQRLVVALNQTHAGK